MTRVDGRKPRHDGGARRRGSNLIRRLPCCAILLLLLISPVAASTGTAPASPGTLCRQAISAAEQSHAIPAGLLSAIGQVESGRRDPTTGASTSWPWTANIDGDGQFFEGRDQALAAVRAAQARNIRSIDVGCMQVNLMHHPKAFRSLEEAFDPVANAEYAAGFLRRLFAQTNDWTQAAALYHSATPALAAEYRRRVVAAWAGAPVRAAISQAPVAMPGSPFGAAPTGFVAIRRQEPASPPPGFGGAAPGRSLAAYRAMPIQIVGPRRGG